MTLENACERCSIRKLNCSLSSTIVGINKSFTAPTISTNSTKSFSPDPTKPYLNLAANSTEPSPHNQTADMSLFTVKRTDGVSDPPSMDDGVLSTDLSSDFFSEFDLMGLVTESGVSGADAASRDQSTDHPTAIQHSPLPDILESEIIELMGEGDIITATIGQHLVTLEENVIVATPDSKGKRKKGSSNEDKVTQESTTVVTPKSKGKRKKGSSNEVKVDQENAIVVTPEDKDARTKKRRVSVANVNRPRTRKTLRCSSCTTNHKS